MKYYRNISKKILTFKIQNSNFFVVKLKNNIFCNKKQPIDQKYYGLLLGLSYWSNLTPRHIGRILSMNYSPNSINIHPIR